MSKIIGSCLCGAVRFESDAEPVMTAACHCSHCRKQSGSAFSVVVAIPADSFTNTGSALKTYEDIGASGKPVLRKFCGECGSPIITEAKAYEGLIFIKAGALDDPSVVEVGAEIWCDSRLEWSNIPSGLTQFPGNPPAG